MNRISFSTFLYIFTMAALKYVRIKVQLDYTKQILNILRAPVDVL